MLNTWIVMCMCVECAPKSWGSESSSISAWCDHGPFVKSDTERTCGKSLVRTKGWGSKARLMRVVTCRFGQVGPAAQCGLVRPFVQQLHYSRSCA